MLNRRNFAAHSVAAVGLYALLEIASAGKALAASAAASSKHWLDEQQQIASDLKAGRLDLLEWQAAVETLATKVDLPDLLAQTDFERLRASFDFSDGMPSKRMVRLNDRAATPPIIYGLAFFGFRRGQVITPHGHRNMVSAHMVARGRFRVRNFDRLSDEPAAILIRPTVDERIGIGRVSTMSAKRNNIHWFVAEEDESVTLDVIVDALAPDEPAYTIDLVDPDGGERRGDGSIVAPMINWQQSVAKYA
jgi:hypothetical protein